MKLCTPTCCCFTCITGLEKHSRISECSLDVFVQPLWIKWNEWFLNGLNSSLPPNDYKSSLIYRLIFFHGNLHLFPLVIAITCTFFHSLPPPPPFNPFDKLLDGNYNLSSLYFIQLNKQSFVSPCKIVDCFPIILIIYPYLNSSFLNKNHPHSACSILQGSFQYCTSWCWWFMLLLWLPVASRF